MRRLASYSFVLVSLLIGISILSTVTPAQTDWRQILIPPLHSFQPKQPKRIQLPNGMVIFLQRSTGRLPGDSCRESRNQWRR